MGMKVKPLTKKEKISLLAHLYVIRWKNGQYAECRRMLRTKYF